MEQKSHSPELISRPLFTTASQENDETKTQNKLKNIDTNTGEILETADDRPRTEKE